MAEAAREGARLAAGGVSRGTAVTLAMVRQEVRNYVTAAALPAAAVKATLVKVLSGICGPTLDRMIRLGCPGSDHGTLACAGYACASVTCFSTTRPSERSLARNVVREIPSRLAASTWFPLTCSSTSRSTTRSTTA